MVKEHYQRITLTLHETTKKMLEKISLETGLTKSFIVQELLNNETFKFYYNRKKQIEKWKEYAVTKK